MRLSYYGRQFVVSFSNWYSSYVTTQKTATWIRIAVKTPHIAMWYSCKCFCRTGQGDKQTPTQSIPATMTDDKCLYPEQGPNPQSRAQITTPYLDNSSRLMTVWLEVRSVHYFHEVRNINARSEGHVQLSACFTSKIIGRITSIRPFTHLGKAAVVTQRRNWSWV